MRYLAPIIITVLVIIFVVFEIWVTFWGLSQAQIPSAWLIVLLLIGIIVILALAYNLIKRLKELKEDDKDDLSKY